MLRKLSAAAIGAIFLLSACAPEKQTSGIVPSVAIAQPAKTQTKALAASDSLLDGLPLPDDKDLRLVRNDGKYSDQTGDVSLYKHSENKTASGERYRRDAMAAAHKTLPFFSIVRCTRTDTGASVVVVINDRGPFIKGRILDVTPAAASKLDLHDDGVAPCRIEVLAYPEDAEERK